MTANHEKVEAPFSETLRACLKIPERGCVVLDQPQWVANGPRSFSSV